MEQMNQNTVTLRLSDYESLKKEVKNLNELLSEMLKKYDCVVDHNHIYSKNITYRFYTKDEMLKKLKQEIVEIKEHNQLLSHENGYLKREIKGLNIFNISSLKRDAKRSAYIVSK